MGHSNDGERERERERESLSSRKVGSKSFQLNRVANQAEGAWGAFCSLQKEYAHWGVKDLDMFGLRTGYVQQPSLEPGLDTGHVWCLALTQV
jgi:hypothetical protein